MTLELTAKEVKVLRELLEDHLHYGWIEGAGEFDVTATWEVSPTLEKLYRRLVAQNANSGAGSEQEQVG